MARKRTTGGRKKIPMKKIENKASRRISFSKRRDGVFKKACELSTLCGVEIVVILFSIGNKPVSFGCPSVSHVLNKFLNVNEEEDVFASYARSYKEQELHQLNQQFNDLNDALASEKRRGKLIKNRTKDVLGTSYEDYVDKLGLLELKQLKTQLEALKRKIDCKIFDFIGESSSSNPPKEVDLSNLEEEEGNASPIPDDWLKLKV